MLPTLLNVRSTGIVERFLYRKRQTRKSADVSDRTITNSICKREGGISGILRYRTS